MTPRTTVGAPPCADGGSGGQQCGEIRPRRRGVHGASRSAAALADLAGPRPAGRAGGRRVCARPRRGRAARSPRTRTSVGRPTRWTPPIFFACNPERAPACPETVEEIRALPGVADAALFLSPQVPVTDGDGRIVQLQDDPCFSGSGALQLLVPRGPEFGSTLHRLRILEGRAADPTRADEVVIAPLIAEQVGVEVGDTLFVNFPTDCLDPRVDWPEPVEVRVVGIGLTAVEVPPKNGFYVQGLHTTPAFAALLPERLADPSDEIRVQQQIGAAVALRLDPGTTLADLADTPGVPDFGEVITSDLIGEPVDAGLQTDANALWLVALVGALATLAVLGPTLARFAGELAEEDRTLASMGWGRPQRMMRGAAHGTVVALVAVVTAVVVMAFASRWTPIGDARTIEPDPGIEVDLLVLLLGAVGLTVLVVGFLALLARRSTRPRARPRQTPLAALAARLGLRPPAVLGIRIGLEPARRQAPIRSTVLAVAVGTAAVVGVLAYTSSAQYLRENPERLGVPWDDFVYVSEAENSSDLLAQAQDWPEVESVSGVLYFTPALSLGPNHVPGRVLAIDTGVGAVNPTVIDGRAPRSDDEILMSPLLASDVGVDIGDVVETSMEIEVFGEDGPEIITTGPFPLEVVGTGPVPLGDGNFDQGTVMTVDGLIAHYPPEAVDPADRDRVDFLAMVRAPGVTDEQVVERLAAAEIPFDPDEFDLETILQNIVSIDRTSTESAPDLLGLFMAALAALVLVYGVSVAVDRNRQDLAVARALGMSPRLQRRTARWAGTAFTAAALALAIPVGLVIGRLAWRRYAEGLGVVPDPVVQGREVVVVAVAALLLAAAVATLAARWQARSSTGSILRSE